MMKASAIFLCAALACVVPADTQEPTPTPVSIHVDLAKPVGSYKPITSWFGYDEVQLHHHEVRQAIARRVA